MYYCQWFDVVLYKQNDADDDGVMNRWEINRRAEILTKEKREKERGQETSFPKTKGMRVNFISSIWCN